MNKKLNKFRLKRLVLLVFALTGFVLQAEANKTFYGRIVVHVQDGCNGGGKVYVDGTPGGWSTVSTYGDKHGDGTTSAGLDWTIQAQALDNYYFANWLDVANNTSPRNVHMEANSDDSGNPETDHYYAHFRHVMLDEPVIYLDLNLANVTIADNKVSGAIYDRTLGSVQTFTEETFNPATQKIYVYQSNNTNLTSTGYKKGEGVAVPQYGGVTTTNGGSVNIIRNDADPTTVGEVLDAWDAWAIAVGRRPTGGDGSGNYGSNLANANKIGVNASSATSIIDLTIDNVWCGYQTYEDPTISTGQGHNGGISFWPLYNDNYSSKLKLHLKGDNRFGNIYYRTNAGANHDFFYIDNADNNHPGTLTVGDLTRRTFNDSRYGNVYYNFFRAVIGTADSYNNYDVELHTEGLIFNSGVIFAGSYELDDCTAIGGGGNANGDVTINGGTITAITSSTGTAIGGGIGVKSKGGKGVVNINGGTVNAFNFGNSLPNIGTAGVPVTAIGGGSSRDSQCDPSEITITNGTVYAYSYGNLGIGGGSSMYESGGNSTINIGASGKSPKIYTGSIGGGMTLSSGKNIGFCKTTMISGEVHGQFVMAQGGTEGCLFDMRGGTVTDAYYAKVKTDGGAVWMDDPNGVVTINGGSITGCHADNGGAVYMSAGEFTLENGDLYSNNAFYNGGALCMQNGKAFIKGGSIYANTTNQYGAGIFVGNGLVEITGGLIGSLDEPSSASVIGKGNRAENLGLDPSVYTVTSRGGGVIMRGGTLKMSGGTVAGNYAGVNGGGLYLINDDANTTGKIDIGGTAVIVKNTAGTKGGGLYVQQNTVLTINGGTIGGDGMSNVAENGGGIAISNGKVVMQSGTIHYNKASELGGGIFINGSGDLTIEGGLLDHNSAKHGGGFYSSWEITFAKVKNCMISNNVASEKGGGIYCGSPISVENGSMIFGNTAKHGGGLYCEKTFEMIGGQLHDNVATGNGGGVYVPSGATVAFNDGTFKLNKAAHGGGAYIEKGGTITMTGSSKFENNSTLDEAGLGGGIYMDGTLNVSGTSLHVWDNYQGGTMKQSNVYLPDYDDFITMTGRLSGSAKVGISVPTVPTPVIYSADRSVLLEQYKAFQSGASQLVDDPGIYDAIYSDLNPYDLDHIFFLGTWRKYIAKTVEDPSPYADGEAFKDINTPELLATYQCYVNGFPPFAELGTHPGAEGNVTADLDMGEYLWTSIGTRSADDTYSTDPFSGTFDGQGHVISNLRSEGLIGFSDYGLFGKINGGTVENVFLKDSDLATGNAQFVGILAAEAANATILNCEGAGTITVTEPGCTIGGLVAQASGNTQIVNSMAMTEMTGGSTMGGLVGKLLAGSTASNSFSNTKFSSPNGYVGGLVGDNTGTVTNCYSRLRTGSATGSSYGSLVGSNSGTVSYSYAPTDNYIKSGSAGTGLGTYGPTVTPYGYGQSEDGDNKVGDTPLCDKLNAGTEGKSDYAKWMRTSASPINGDYPILKLDYQCVGSEDGIVLQYGTADQNFKRLSNGTALLYNSAEINENQPSGLTLYIDEEATLLQNTTTPMKAYAGVTFDNSGKLISDYDWHMFSSPLSDAPVAIKYTDNTQVPYGHDVHPVQYGFYPESTYDGYFPSNTPYGDYDFYCFDEPSCHWINFKRNSNSHWHEDGEHEQISYTNEKYLVPGKGYLMALAKETYMQSHGTLNNGDVTVTVTATAPEGYSAGYNLLGNPYQSYLDFDAFAEANEELWNDGDTESYLILDADKSGYVSYVVGGSEGGEYAPRYLHPHQGFYVKVDNTKESTLFTNSMRRLAGTESSHFRGTGWSGQRNCPLVNLYATDSDGKREIVVVELEREEQSGARKMKAVVNGACQMYASADGEDYSVLFMPGHATEVPVRFEAFSEGEFTMTWNTHNAEFSYLHLIDNMTGNDVDCLLDESYTFTASPSDYASRFKLRFEYMAEEPAKAEGNDVFSYQRDGELVVCGMGYMQLVDLQGHVLLSTRLTDEVNVLPKPSVSAGLYVIQLVGEDGLKVQKIVIQ